MQSSIRLLAERRFLPLFVTQFLGAFNDNLFKTAMVMLVTYQIYTDPSRELVFNAVAGGLLVLPFFLLSATAGQLADRMDKARIIRWVKTAEILIMVAGAAGLFIASVPLMLAAMFAMGVHSTFFGPIKYAILPQHLGDEEVLGGTGLVEAGTYVAILGGTIIGGIIPAPAAAAGVLAVALIGRLSGQQVPPAPPAPEEAGRPIDFHVLRASIRLVSGTMHVRRLFLAIIAISFFWGQGAILAAQFPPLVKNVLTASKEVATLFLAIFSVGVAAGSVAVNRLLKGAVSARFAPAAAILMGLFVSHLYWSVRDWPAAPSLVPLGEFVRMHGAGVVMFDIFGVAFAGGMFVVPLYAFLTTTVAKAQCARTVAANNIVNSGAMVLAAVLAGGLAMLKVGVAEALLLVSVGSVGAAAIAWRLHKACEG
jgi:hypothetical protein